MQGILTPSPSAPNTFGKPKKFGERGQNPPKQYNVYDLSTEKNTVFTI